MLANGQDTGMNEYSSQRDSAQIKEASNSSTLDTIKGFFLNSFSCFSEPNNQGCIQKMFLILSLVGTLLSVIGAIFSLIHRVNININLIYQFNEVNSTIYLY